LDKHGEVVPNLQVRRHHFGGALFIIYLRNGHLLQVFLDHILEVAIQFICVVHAVALLHNNFVKFGEFTRRYNLCFPVRLDEGKHLVHIFSLDQGFSLFVAQLVVVIMTGVRVDYCFVHLKDNFD